MKHPGKLASAKLLPSYSAHEQNYFNELKEQVSSFYKYIEHLDVKPLSLSHAVYRWPISHANGTYSKHYRALIKAFQSAFYSRQGYSLLEIRSRFSLHTGIELISDITSSGSLQPIDQGIRFRLQKAWVYVPYPKTI